MTYVTLVEQSARFLKSIIYFDNLYLNTSLVKAYMNNMVHVKNLSKSIPFNATGGGYEVLNQLPTSLPIGTLTRFTDFF
jgi:hypothetical protein